MNKKKKKQAKKARRVKEESGSEMVDKQHIETEPRPGTSSSSGEAAGPSFRRVKSWSRPEEHMKLYKWDAFQIKSKGYILCRERIENYASASPLVLQMLSQLAQEESLEQTIQGLLDGLIVFDEECEESLRETVHYYIDKNLCVGCFKVENNKSKELIALNIHVMKVKGGSDAEELGVIKNPILRRFITEILDLERNINFYEIYAVDKYLASRGLLVSPSHRRKAIGLKMMQARKRMCEQFSIPAALDVFVDNISRGLGLKCNYIELHTLSSMELIKKRVTAMKSEGISLMGLKYDLGASESSSSIPSL